MVYATLGVIFGDKERGILPDGGLREKLHDPSESKVVVGNK
jgi:hypothetical protein